jgi:photosystem II stability/assembly factor-like uncharacterized protein
MEPPDPELGTQEPDLPDATPAERLSPRRLRAAALVALAVFVVAATSAAFLHSPLAPKPPAQSPTISPLLTTENSVTYDFVTPSLGWAAVHVAPPSASEGKFEVFRTVDGAEHWQQQLQGNISMLEFVPLSVQLFSKSGFMAVGGPVQLVYRTTDGGSHWSPVLLPPSPRIDDVAFNDASHGWLLASSTSSGSQALNLFATHDAGTSWQRLPDPPIDANNLSFRSPNEAWLGSIGHERPHIYTSRDAGQSWQRHDLPGSWDTAVGSIEVAEQLLPVTGVLAFVTCQCPHPGPTPLTSFDGGMIWRAVSLPAGNVAYQDARNWWAIDGKLLFKSRDAGQTWTQVSDKLPDWQSVPNVLDSQHAWAMLFDGNGFGLGLTHDGGLHWTRAAVPQST